MRFYSTTFLTILAILLSSTAWSADFDAGQKAYNSGDYETALNEWQPLAETGHVTAQFSLGLMYANGFGVPFDNEQALKWYRLAADQGNGDAQCNLGVMYANGWGVPQSDESAFEWYSRAAEYGVTEAQLNIARMYLHGFGIEESKVQAHKWFSIAVTLGDIGAKVKRDDIAKKLQADELEESNLLVEMWMQKHENLLASQ